MYVWDHAPNLSVVRQNRTVLHTFLVWLMRAKPLTILCAKMCVINPKCECYLKRADAAVISHMMEFMLAEDLEKG